MRACVRVCVCVNVFILITYNHMLITDNRHYPEHSVVVGTTDPPVRSKLVSHGKAANDKDITCLQRFRLGHSRPLLFRPPVKVLDFVTDRLAVRTNNNVYFLY